MTGFLDSLFGMPVLRRVSETDQGPHRSATPESTHMQNIQLVHEPQDDLGFIREGFVIFSAEQAEAVLAHCRYDRQRNELKAKAHIATLAEQMRRGLWLPKTQIDFARVGSRMVLVNGNHRMHAQVMAGSDILWSVVIHDCANEDEVAQLYWKFDTTLRKRTTSNVVGGIGLASDLGIGKQFADSLWACAGPLHRGLRFRGEYGSVDILPDDRVGICREYAAEAKILEDAAKKAPLPIRRKMKTVSVMSIALVTLRHQPEKAYEFWIGLCEDDGLAKGDPRKTFIKDMYTRNGMKGLLVGQMMACTRAWNAFYHGQDLKHLKVTGHAVQVAGTPFTVQA